MSNTKRILAGLLLVIGLLILFLGVIDLIDRTETRESKEGALAAMVLFGLPSVAIATGLILNLRQQRQQQNRQLSLEKEQIFLQLLRQQNGTVTVAKFALSAKISLEDAKEYLDQKAQQLDADFEVGDEYEIIYKFPL